MNNYCKCFVPRSTQTPPQKQKNRTIFISKTNESVKTDPINQIQSNQTKPNQMTIEIITVFRILLFKVQQFLTQKPPVLNGQAEKPLQRG